MAPQDLASVALMGSAGLAAIVFVGAYAVRSAWWTNQAGMNTMFFMSVVATFLVLGLYFFVTDTRAPSWLRMTMWGLVNIPLWWRVIILWRAQHGTLSASHSCTQCGKKCDG